MKKHSLSIILSLLVLLTLSARVASAICYVDFECLQDTIGLTAEEIAALPQIELEQLPPNEDLMYDRAYRQMNGAVDLYDAPNGNVVAQMPAGFNFITVSAAQDGWTQSDSGHWIRNEFLTDTTHIVSHFTGVYLPEEVLPYQIAWALVNMYPSPAPGEGPSEQFDLIYRYTRLNIYATHTIDGVNWYQIAPDQWVEQFHVAKVIPVERFDDIDTERWISIDLYEQVVIAYEGNTLIFATMIATGLPRWETLEGIFHIYYRRTRIEMSAGTPGDDFYYLEEVPWTMFFDEGRALHGAYWHDGLGYRRSHGCVNLSITDANWFYTWVAQDFDSLNSPDREDGGPAVYVYHSGQYIGEA